MSRRLATFLLVLLAIGAGATGAYVLCARTHMPGGMAQMQLLQPDPASGADIRALLTKQVADWNRGDLDAFATGYKNSPDILFIGRTISRGYAQMLASYKKGYASHEAMGTLSFTNLDVQPLDRSYATTTGNFHLERTAQGGGNADGYFLLVLENTPQGWKIIRDDTTATPQSQKQ